MNIENRKNQQQSSPSQGTATNMIKLAAWAVIAGGIFAAPALSQVGPDKGPADESVAAVDSAPVAQPEPTAPKSADPEPVKPTTPDATAPKPTTPAPTTPDPEVAKPTTPDVIVPKPTTTAPAVPDVVVPQPADLKTPATQPVVAKPTVPDPELPVAAPARPAAQPAVTPKFSMVSGGLDADGGITLMVNKSNVLTTRLPYKRVSIAQPDVADVNLVGPSEVLLTAKKPGATQLILWDDQDRSQIVDVLVNFDLSGLSSQIKAMFPKAVIRAESANGVIVLRGHVPDLGTAKNVAAVAAPYGPGGPTGVLNLLEISGGQQVVLQVRFAEVSRSVTQNLGFNAFATDGKFTLGLNNGPGGSPAGALATGATAGVPATVPLFGSAKAGAASFEMFLNALRSNSLLRILAEPNLTAISGEKASFLAGGEFPIPVPQAGSGGTTITIEYKTFGIKLNFTPTVLGDGRVLLHCAPEVSELDFTDAVTLNGYVIPGLTTRNVDTTVELADGQTFALAGLLQNQIKANKNITPLLGDMPVIGALFRSVQYSRSETELVVLVTPRLVEGLNPGQVPKLPGEFWRDPNEAQLFLGADLGGPAPDLRHAPAIRSNRFYGPSGFNPAPIGTSSAEKK